MGPPRRGPGPFTGARRVPDDSTLGRVLAGIDADALDAAVCRWLISRAGAAGSGRRVIAVDGKTLQGNGPAGAQVHLLAAVDHRDGIVLAQSDVNGKRMRSPGSPLALDFPHAVQALRIRRRRYNPATDRRSTVTVYAITNLTAEQAGPAELADWLRGHWSIDICSADCTYV